MHWVREARLRGVSPEVLAYLRYTESLGDFDYSELPKWEAVSAAFGRVGDDDFARIESVRALLSNSEALRFSAFKEATRGAPSIPDILSNPQDAPLVESGTPAAFALVERLAQVIHFNEAEWGRVFEYIERLDVSLQDTLFATLQPANIKAISRLAGKRHAAKRWLLVMSLGLCTACASITPHRYDVAPELKPRYEELTRDEFLSQLFSKQNLVILHPFLERKIHELENESPTFRDAMEDARNGKARVLIASASDVNRWLPHMKSKYDRTAHAGVTISFQKGNIVDEIVVLINLELIEKKHVEHARRTGERDPAVLQSWFEHDVKSVLIHELYGHMAPVAKSGLTKDICYDPPHPDAYLLSCVGKRENAIRAELGLTKRVSYGHTPASGRAGDR